MDFHPACLALPKMSADEFLALCASMRLGFDPRHPILVHGGQILDGRHRYEACVAESVEPRYLDWIGGDPYDFVRREHEARRSWLSGEQKHLVILDLVAGSEAWTKAHRQIAADANQARSEKAKGNQNARHYPEPSDKQKIRIDRVLEQWRLGLITRAQSNARISKIDPDCLARAVVKYGSGTGSDPTEPDPNRGAAQENSGATTCGATESNRKRPSKQAQSKAAMTGVSRGAVQRSESLLRHRPDLAEKVKTGEVKATAAVRQMREDKSAADLHRPIDVALPDGLHHGDFRELSRIIPDDSVDLIFTDPPYDGDSVHLYEAAAEIGARILKPGGSLIAYSGQSHLPEVLAGMSKHLRYWWTIAGIHQGGNQLLQKIGIRCGWKPLVWFVKGTRGDVQNILADTVRGDREKDTHDWQQSVVEAQYYIEKLTVTGGVVVDFCLGGGTTYVAALKFGRKCIAFEVDAGSIERAAKRIDGLKAA